MARMEETMSNKAATGGGCGCATVIIIVLLLLILRSVGCNKPASANAVPPGVAPRNQEECMDNAH